jgi:GAF domain-containing protein
MRQDTSRLAELRRALILDSGPERVYDEITRLLATTLGVPFTMVNMLDAERDWFKSFVGTEPGDLPAANSLCEAFFTTTDDLIVVEDTLLDPQLESHPKVLGQPHIRFYAAARLKVRGQTIGTLCACDTEPRQLSADERDQLRTLASVVVQLIARRGHDTEQAAARA